MKKMNFYTKSLAFALAMIVFAPACSDLEEELFDAVTEDNFFRTEEELISALGAAYTSLYGIMSNGGFVCIQEVASDEMVVPTRGPDWGDGGVWTQLHEHTWDPENDKVIGSWNFVFNGINTCNRLIFQFTELGNPLTDPFIGELQGLRAIYYLWGLDTFGNIPISTDFTVTEPPAPSSRAEVYAFVEQELLEAIPKVTREVGGAAYGRVNEMTLRTALAKLYLNAEVYSGTPQWAKAAEQCDLIINSGSFSLEPDYFTNFAADNEGSQENIFSIPYDEVFATGFNLSMQTNHIVSGQATYQLTAQPWNGWCAVEEFVNSYEDTDLRKGQPGTEEGPSRVRGNFLWGAQWDASGTVRQIDENTALSGTDPDGPPITLRVEVNELKPNAWREAGARVAKYEFPLGTRPDMNNDFPVFRYADVLLMKAEALWRQDAGSTEALALVNQVRDRADVDPFTELTAENLLAERGREMFFELHRRTDQIRFGVWGDAWWAKAEKPECYELFPIPAVQLQSNPRLVQNECY